MSAVLNTLRALVNRHTRPAIPAPIHEPDAYADDTDAEGTCIPRVALDCVGCGRRFVYCHIGRLTLRRYLDARDADGNSTWGCRGATP